MSLIEQVKYCIQKAANIFGYEIHKKSTVDKSLIPPFYIRSIVGNVVNPDYYLSIGEQFFNYFKYLCGLKRGENVLDIGCGCGRTAIHLTGYLDPGAKYEGFDIVPALIEWCTANISAKYPNFHFQVNDIFNENYNQKGRYKASEYRFPYADATFDFIFLLSVFTHMLPPDMENYFSEISRVLKKGKKCLITYFLLNAESLFHIESNLSTMAFNNIYENYRSVSNTVQENAIAYSEDYILSLYDKYGFKIVKPVYHGSWCGRANYLSYQDIIIAVKI